MSGRELYRLCLPLCLVDGAARYILLLLLLLLLVLLVCGSVVSLSVLKTNSDLVNLWFHFKGNVKI